MQWPANSKNHRIFYFIQSLAKNILQNFNLKRRMTSMQGIYVRTCRNFHFKCTQILSCVRKYCPLRKYCPVYANIVLCILWEQFKETQCSLCKGRRKALRYLLFFFLQICPIRLSPKFQFLLPKFYSVFQMLNSFFKIVDSFLRMLNSFIEIF